MGTGPDLVLLAGGRIDGDFAARWGTSVKALVPLDGRTLLDRTLDAYDDLHHLGRRVLIGPAELSAESAARRVDTVLSDRGSALENVVAALEWLQETPGAGPEWVVLSATDLPFLTCEAVDEFLCRCSDTIDFCVPIVERRPFEARFPGVGRDFTRLRDGAWKVGGMLLARAPVLLERQSRLERLFTRRQRPLDLARLLGLPTLLSVLTRRATVPQLERRLSQVLGCRTATAISRHPEIAFDVDHPESLRGAAEWFQHSVQQRPPARRPSRRAA